MKDLLFVLLGVALGVGALFAERIAVQRMGVRRAVRAAVKYQKELKATMHLTNTDEEEEGEDVKALEDERDADIARQRLREVELDPSKLVRGKALDDELDRLESIVLEGRVQTDVAALPCQRLHPYDER